MLGNMRFNIDEQLTPNEKGNLNMLIMSMKRPDLLNKALGGSLTRNEVKEFIDPLKNLITNCENDDDPNSAADLIGSVAKSILAKFEDFLG